MTIANDTTTPHASHTQPALKPLWIAIGALGAAVVALGGTLAYQNLRTDHAAVTPVAVTASAAAPAMAGVQSPHDDLVQAPRSNAVAVPQAVASAPVVQAPAPVVRTAPAPVVRAPAVPAGYRQPAYSANYPHTPMPVSQVCETCGRIESVTPVQRTSPTPGVAGIGIGAVAGGVLGGVLGNQIGHGSGRAAATVLGAVAAVIWATRSSNGPAPLPRTKCGCGWTTARSAPSSVPRRCRSANASRWKAGAFASARARRTRRTIRTTARCRSHRVATPPPASTEALHLHAARCAHAKRHS